MSPPTPLVAPKVERSANVTVITFIPDAIRDVENVIGRELHGLTGGTGVRHLLLDFTNVEYLNSMELGTLVNLHKQAAEAGGRLTLFNLSDQVFKLFKITRLDSFLDICREGTAPQPERLPSGVARAPDPSATRA